MCTYIRLQVGFFFSGSLPKFRQTCQQFPISNDMLTRITEETEKVWHSPLLFTSLTLHYFRTLQKSMPTHLLRQIVQVNMFHGKTTESESKYKLERAFSKAAELCNTIHGKSSGFYRQRRHEMTHG